MFVAHEDTENIRKVTWICPSSPVLQCDCKAAGFWWPRDLFRIIPKSFNEPLHFLGFSLDTDMGLKFPECFIQLHCGEVHLIHHTARTETDSHRVSPFLTIQYQRQDFETEKTFWFSIWQRFMELMFFKLSAAIATIAGKLWGRLKITDLWECADVSRPLCFLNRRAAGMTNGWPL